MSLSLDWLPDWLPERLPERTLATSRIDFVSANRLDRTIQRYLLRHALRPVGRRSSSRCWGRPRWAT
jgi:hypothetical protein